jgi:hypothetical protein
VLLWVLVVVVVVEHPGDYNWRLRRVPVARKTNLNNACEVV